jgi:hypothetical protein
MTGCHCGRCVHRRHMAAGWVLLLAWPLFLGWYALKVIALVVAFVVLAIRTRSLPRRMPCFRR